MIFTLKNTVTFLLEWKMPSRLFISSVFILQVFLFSARLTNGYPSSPNGAFQKVPVATNLQDHDAPTTDRNIDQASLSMNPACRLVPSLLSFSSNYTTNITHPTLPNLPHLPTPANSPSSPYAIPINAVKPRASPSSTTA